MTTKICHNLITLESELAKLNSKLQDEQNTPLFSLKANRKKITENVDKAEKLHLSVANLIKEIETKLKED
jgi:hypothetical protein